MLFAAIATLAVLESPLESDYRCANDLLALNRLLDSQAAEIQRKDAQLARKDEELGAMRLQLMGSGRRLQSVGTTGASALVQVQAGGTLNVHAGGTLNLLGVAGGLEVAVAPAASPTILPSTPPSPSPPGTPPSPSPPLSCPAATNIAQAASCRMSTNNGAWAGGSFDCSALIDGTVAWSMASGRHVGADPHGKSWVVLRFSAPTIVQSMEFCQFTSAGQGDKHGDFLLQILNSDGVTWNTVATYGDNPSDPSYISNGDVSYTLPSPLITTGVRFFGSYTADVYRVEEFKVEGCLAPPPPPAPPAPPSPPASPPVTDAYLGSDIPATSCSGSCKVDESFDNEVITIQGVEYAKGYGIHTDAHATFSLAGQYNTFSTCIGNSTPRCQVSYGSYTEEFRVEGDAQVLRDWQSLRNDADAVCFTVSVAGVQTLTLSTQGANVCTHAVFADAKVY